MKLQKVFFILLLSISSLFAIPNTAWNKQNIFIEVKQELLQGNAQLLKNFTRLQNFYKQRQNRKDHPEMILSSLADGLWLMFMSLSI